MEKIKINYNQRKLPFSQGNLAPSLSRNYKYKIRACICTVINSSKDNIYNVVDKLDDLKNMMSEVFTVYVDISQTETNTDILTKTNNTVLIKVNETQDIYTKARNLYLQFVLDNIHLIDIMIVVDAQRALHNNFKVQNFSCLYPENLSKWDVVFANQSYKYYDIESLIGNMFNKDLSNCSYEEKCQIIKKYQQHIPDDTGYISVKSAFGGLAIYKTEFLDKDTIYSSDGHKSFNLSIYKKTTRMYIDSTLMLISSENNNDCFY